MTLKYESELLFDLMKRDGDIAPSDVLPYESELKEKYLNQVVGAYPKLQDYQPEWLYYNLYHHLPSEFPVDSVANVTSASFDNVVPYAYKSAILKGKTDENLQSVKMPVLRATGKNLFNINAYTSLKNNATIEGEWLILWENYQTSGCTWDVTLAPNTTYYVSDFIDSDITTNSSTGRFRVADKMGNEILKLGSFNRLLTTTNECDYIFEIGRGSNFIGSITKFKIQIEQSTQATPFEPYKSNILTTSEEVELRGVGNVKDTLDCLTGEVTERISEIVLDGSEEWAVNGDRKTVVSYICNTIIGSLNANNIKCSEFPTRTDGLTNNVEMIRLSPQNGKIIIHILKSKVGIDVNTTVTKGDDASHFKQWLSKNPITVQYELTTESIKTVNLSCINEQGESVTFRPIEGTMHVSTSSQTLLPLLDMSVPIEATSQNLMSFVNIVEEE